MPMDRRQALVRGETLPDRASGAALFADISGFTPLTAALAQELGPQRGAEELARLLNQVYGALIAEVHRYGGSVIGFGGDAITCWMDEGTASPPRSGGSVTARPGPEQAPSASPPRSGGSVTARPGPGQAGLRAVACGLAMQNAMAQFVSVATPTGTSFSLAIKVAVVVGPARRFLVGDPQVQNLEVIAGRTLDLLARAEHHAQRGEVVADADVVNQAGGQIEVAEWRTDAETGQRIAVISGLAEPVAPAPWPDVPPDCLPEAQCRPWLLPGVYKRLCSGTRQFLAELRPTTALFLSFKGIDYDLDDQAGEKLDAYVRWVQAEIERYGGSLLQVIVGDKGSHLLAAFGAPVAHHDDEVRAVSAALALQSTPPEFKFITGVQIGVAQGQMRVGTCGSTARRTYGLQGDKVNLAARLMQAATDGMLCDEAIYRTAQARLVFAPLPAITVKGKIEPVAVYRPTGEKRHLTRSQARLIGHTAECVLLRESLQNVLHGASSIVIVEGEAGIGKSRLIAELRQQAETMQVTTLSVVGDAAEKSTPFYAWRDVFRKLVNLGSHPDPDEQRQRLTDLLQDQPEHLRLVPLLNPMLSLAPTDTEVTASLTGQARADRTRDLLIALLQNSLKQSPKAIFVENAQDLDPASWTLTLAVSQRLPSLLLVIAARPLPEPLSTGYAQLQQTAHVQTLSLKALSPDEAYLLACEHLGAGSLPKPVVELLRKAAGNPSVIEELVYQLRDDGYITVADGKCQVAPDVDLQDTVFPTTAQAVIISRIDRLSPSEQLTLKVASVIGRVFSRHMLYDVFPVASDKPHLDKHLQTLERLDLIVQKVPQPTYTFKNLLTQEAAYNSMLYSQRRQLHRLVAEWHERTFRDNLAPHYATLAHHWCQADDPARAIDYLEKASQRALRNGAYQEAERLLQESLELDARSGVLSAGFYDRVST
jgi:class 3 adenylate cyclase/tetratricopeptide (TPR) repeat protein